MSTPTPSDAAVATLLRGEPLSLGSGKVAVEKLGAPAKQLLGVLWSERAELGQRKPADQAVRVRALYSAAAPAPAEVLAEPPKPVDPARPRWRLHHLRCRSVRGIAPFGEAFEFAVRGEATLIYGPNGSGKSSLLNAIGWVLTGRVATDGDADATQVPLYQPAKAGGKPTKLRDWPVEVSLPHGSDPKKVTPSCSAELVLKTADAARTLHLRRTGGLLEESADGIGWRPCPDLAAHGITPLDVQLSISAATVFGRRSLESSPDTRHLLSMLLGYDALEEFGSLVTGLATALTKAATAEGQELTERKGRVHEQLRALTLPAGHPLLGELAALTGPVPPPAARVNEVRARVTKAIASAEAELAGALELGACGTATNLAAATDAALALLSRPWPDLFPALASADLTGEWSTNGGSGSPAALAAELDALELAFAARVAERLGWWRRESEPGSRAALLMHAAAYFDPDAHACPVCDQSLLGNAVEQQLIDLKGAAAESRAELRVFFLDLVREVEGAVPARVRRLAKVEPGASVRSGWEALKRALGPSLGGVVARYDPVLQEIASAAVPAPAAGTTLVPADADDAFHAAARGLVEAFREARQGIAVAAWAAAHFAPLVERIGAALTAPEAGSSSLYAALARGKQAAAGITPLTAAHTALGAASAEMAEVAAADARHAQLGEIRVALDELKSVGKYADAEVEHVFAGIRDATVEYFGKLYPNANPDLVFTRLHLNKGRDKTVEAYLGSGGFEFPGQHVANAGCIRAVALAFYFALLGRHPGGLNFVVMDDPILSLDENHREAWSSNVLRPALAGTQVILATHQRQFLSNCRSDFRPGRLVELNPRTRSRQLTWRPGDRLENAERMLATDWNSVAVELRKYREELVITLDAYSPTPFFTRTNLKDSLDRYAKLAAPNPLAGPNQKIAPRLRDEKVARVLDPGSHAMTEADVTEPMVRVCLSELLKLDEMFRKELDRLEELRLRELRSKSVPAEEPGAPDAAEAPATIPLERLRIGDDRAAWRDPLPLRVIGAAAAQTRGCVVDLAELPSDGRFPPGGAVLVVGDGLAPLARPGQWALLADPDARVADGDYAAVADQSDNAYLRRVWSAGDAWLLEAINPLAGLGPVRVRKCACIARKVIGISYADPKAPKLGATRKVQEWHPRGDFPTAPLKGAYGVTIRGTSLEPIAGDGHVVVVGAKLVSQFEGVRPGSLAVVETEDDRVGSVIKRVYPGARAWQLVSPNPVEPREPLTVARGKLRAVWPLRGVLFELSLVER